MNKYLESEQFLFSLGTGSAYLGHHITSFNYFKYCMNNKVLMRDILLMNSLRFTGGFSVGSGIYAILTVLILGNKFKQ